MLTLDSIVLYVDNVQVSQTFYTETFNCTAQVLSPTFVALDFATNVKITLKQTSDLAPISNITGGGTELSIPVPDKASFDKLYRDWTEQGVQFAQSPEEMIFGFNFVALDPDGHRIRVFTA
ncbi:glyoxalase [Vibrio sp. T187]|uniref:VOC family protein n=1 Tax=Vibrio TaxID=662 RepID=UPI0010CA0DE3|nr:MULTISPECIES: VOC family protein [Vibrio]MBW3695322.1 glyoxalase [Vibrio sp. T187]